MTALAAFQQAQKDLQAVAYAELLDFWRTLDPSDALDTAQRLQAFLPALVQDYGEVGAAAAADFYDELRDAAPTRAVYTAVMGDPAPVEQIQASTRWAASPLFGGSGPEAALVNVVGITSKLVLAPSRETIVFNTSRDPDARGFMRVTSDGACRFCRFLADRGAVYRADTARFAAHGHCHCSAVPSWDESAAPASVEQYLASTRRRSPSDRARLRAALDDYEAPTASTDALAA